MNPPEDARVYAQMNKIDPQFDQLLSGSVTVWLAPGQDPVRYKSIKVGLKAISKLDLGPGRMGEEDLLFHRQVIHDPGPDGGLLDQTPLR